MLVVKKFGGSSVADKERIFNVARRCAEEYQMGNDVIVVLSAMGDTTDELLEKAAEINPYPSKRELDMLLTTGEQVSVALMAMALQFLNVPAISLNAFQVKMHSTARNGNARFKRVDTDRITHELENRKIVIVTGFQGVNHYGDYTTLGRGGSDTTAVALAAAMHADKCEIYTDVDGVYTADPRVVPNARKIEEITYDEMLELATSGAKVLHNRSVEMAKKYGVELVVRSSLNTEEGTLEQRRMESRHILMFRGKIIQDGHTFYVYLRKDVQSVLEVIEGTRLYLAVVLLLMVGLSYFLEKMSKASTEKKAKQSDYQLLESQREFVANISHELKTPLAVVSSQVEMLEIAGDKIDRSYYYSSIHEELDKMSRMVGELLDFSMLDNQMSSMEMSRVNVSEMIEYLLLRYDAMFRKNEIKVEQEIEKNCFAYGNRMYLERAVNNYLMNAFQHTEQGKRIRITLKKEKKQIRMEVYNDGAQIKEEQMEHIWDSFYTTSQKKKPVTSENEVRNIGLGLFVVRKIVDKHKGSCGAQNLENGVMFWLQLPEIRDLGK